MEMARCNPRASKSLEINEKGSPIVLEVVDFEHLLSVPARRGQISIFSFSAESVEKEKIEI